MTANQGSPVTPLDARTLQDQTSWHPMQYPDADEHGPRWAIMLRGSRARRCSS